METTQEAQTPTTEVEPTTPSNSDLLAEREAQIATLKQKEVELQKQKEHWREKYERDILKPQEPAQEDVYSDEGKVLKGEISSLNEKLKAIEKKETRRELEIEFPILKERKGDFDEFLEDDENKNLSVKKAAKLFLAERNLLSPEPPERKGLEKPTAGGQKIPSSTPSEDELEDMRKNDYRKYEQLIRSGKI